MSEEETGTALAEIEALQPTEVAGVSGFLRFVENFDTFSRVSKMLAESGMYKHKNAKTVGAIILQAMEMGIPIGTAMNGMYVVGGKTGMEGQLMLALAVSRCGVTVEEVKRTEDCYEAILRRPGWEPYTVMFDTEMALKAGLVRKQSDGSIKAASGKPTYDTHRRDMYQWRAISQGLRVIAPDFFAHVYSMDEVMLMEERDLDAHKHDTSEELRTIVAEDIVDEEIGQLQALIDKAETLDLDGAELLSFSDRENIAHTIEARDIERIRGWIGELEGLLDKAKWAESDEEQTGMDLD